MKILSRLSIRNLKLNKKRAISTIIGIILSVALICAVATMVTSFQQTLVENAINESGYWHLKLDDVNDEIISELNNNRDIKQIYTVNEIGYAKLNNSQNEYKPYLRLVSMDEEIFEQLKFNLIKGRYPKNESEIIISKHIIDNGKVNYEVGEKIKIKIGERRTLDNYELYTSNAYIMQDEHLVNEKEMEFTIVGIIERPTYSFEEYSSPGYTVITTNMNDGKEDAYISLKDVKEYKTSMEQILGASDFNQIYKQTENLKYNFEINDELLRWEAFAFSDSTVTMLYTICGIVIFIIIFTSVFCIRNSFAIATTEKIKMYGMLASVGATKKQIRKNVIFEAFILGAIGIPLGILSGIFAVFVLLKIVNVLIGEALLNNIDGIVFKVNVQAILLSIILGIITIYLSAISSARKASKVTPIEGLRNNNEIKIKAKKLKTPKIVSKIFKTGGVLAYKNLKRSKKKYRTTVISITVSIFLFITMNVLITNMFDTTDYYYTDYDYNIRIYGSIHDLPQEQINRIISLKECDEVFVLYHIAETLEVIDKNKINYIEGLDDDEYEIRMQIKALDDETFKKYVEKIGAKYEEVKTSGILCDNCQYYNDELGNVKEFRRYKYNKNDIINGIYDGNEINIRVGAVTDIKPYGIENAYCDGGYLILNLDEYKSMNFTEAYLSIQSSEPDKLEDEISKINEEIMVNNMDKSVKEQKSMILVINIFLYGFITVITLIGVTNIFNTITSNMELRQKEFAMLKSIGMTRKEFNNMINLETIFYSTKSLIYGILLGLLGTFALYKAFSVKFDSGIYIPIRPIVLSIVFVFILVYVIMKYSISKINKQNTIETIRKENV